MRHRILTLAVFVCVLFSGTQAASARTHGPLLMGRAIDTTAAFSGATGNCSCSYQWYTIGVRPGPLHVAIKMHSYYGKIAPTWGVRAVLLLGKRQVDWGQSACMATQKICNRNIDLKARVPRTGIYYVKLEGPGASEVAFTIQIQGRLYRLHCKQYC